MKYDKEEMKPNQLRVTQMINIILPRYRNFIQNNM